MSQKAEFLQLENSDDTTSVRDRLSFLRGQRVLMIWPEEGTVLTRKLDLVLIQREAMRQAIRLALVTHDPQIVKHATELNISTFETIGAAERSRWKRGRAKVFTTRLQRPEDEPEADDLKPVASRVLNDEEPNEGRAGRVIVRGVVLLTLLGAMFAVAYFLVPSASVVITPAQERIPVDISIVADPQVVDIDLENRVVPAVTLRVEIEDTGTLPTTGTQRLSDVPASGSVVFINQTDEEVEIPADTIVSTSAGTPILFHTLEDATVPAEVGGQIEVPIEAMSGSDGERGNVDAGLINTVTDEFADTITVRNLSPTLGGESRTASVVSQSDQDRLLATLRQQLQSRAYLGMEAQSTESQTIILETIHITEEREDWKQWSAQPGDVADALTLTMRAVVEATVIDETLARQVAFSALTAQIPAGRALVPDSLAYSCCDVQDISPDKRVTFTMTGDGLVEGQVNTGLIQEKLAGRTPEDAVRYLLSEVDLAEGTTPLVTVSPDWFGKLPLLPMRISVRVQDAAA
jgi:hypothetical protein